MPVVHEPVPAPRSAAFALWPPSPARARRLALSATVAAALAAGRALEPTPTPAAALGPATRRTAACSAPKLCFESLTALITGPDPALAVLHPPLPFPMLATDRKSTRLNSSHVAISYAVFCL